MTASGSGYRDDREAAAARIATLEEELREIDARRDPKQLAEQALKERPIRERLESLTRGRRRLLYASAAIFGFLVVSMVVAAVRGSRGGDLVQRILWIVIAALFVHGSRTGSREEERLRRELSELAAAHADPRRAALERELEDARAALRGPENG